MRDRSIGDVFGTALAVLFSVAIVGVIGLIALAVWGAAVWLR